MEEANWDRADVDGANRTVGECRGLPCHLPSSQSPPPLRQEGGVNRSQRPLADVFNPLQFQGATAGSSSETLLVQMNSWAFFSSCLNSLICLIQEMNCKMGTLLLNFCYLLALNKIRSNIPYHPFRSKEAVVCKQG